jgi:hypothetical protein
VRVRQHRDELPLDFCGVMIEIHYPPFINPCALLIGKMRDVCNAEMKEEQTQFKRDGDVDVLGLRGELVAQYFAFTQGKNFVPTQLLASRPLQEPDITLGGKRFDVKAIRPTAPYLQVNETAHLKSKNITDYWFVQCFNKNQARFWWYTHNEIDEWETVDAKYSKVYQKKISEIKEREE